MSDSNDPGFVFRLCGIGLMVIGTFNGSGLVAAVALKGLTLDSKWLIILLIVAIALPFIGGFMLASDRVRDAVINWADKSSWVPFKKSGGASA